MLGLPIMSPASAARTASASAPAVAVNSTAIGRLDLFELTFRLPADGTRDDINPYHSDEIRVIATFTSPTHRTFAVDGFTYQDFARSGPPEQLAALGAPVWKVRFTPTETGVWTYTVRIITPNAAPLTVASRTFRCLPSTLKGFVQRSKRNSRYLQYSDGSQYIPIGQNLGWGNWGMENGTYSYDTWQPKIAAQGGNFARYWMWSDFHGIEWTETGLGDYTKRQNEAWRLDHDLEVARRNHIQVMLTLLNHGAVSTRVDPQWLRSPYYKGNGGPCATPDDFFTDPTARAFFKQRLRYIVARWGYASNLIWELTNEIDNTDGYLTDARVRADVAAWHREMAAYIKSLDPNHLVTTSFSRFQDDPAIWAQPDIDLTQFHFYSPSPTAEDAQAAIIARYRSLAPAKPVLGGEMGFPAGGAYSVANDPQGIQWHNAQWASLLSGAAGSSALWWWADYIEPKNLYTHYRGLSNFAAALDFAGSGFTPTQPAISPSNRSDLVLTGYPDWGFRAEANHFVIHKDGTLVPGEDRLAAYLYGLKDNAERRNPPTFEIDCPAAAELRLVTGAPHGNPRLIATVDGKTAYSGSPAKDATVTIPLTAGHHSLSLDNPETGWVEVANYIFTAAAPPFKAYALQGPNTVAAWIVNRGYNYAAVRDHGLPLPTTGTLHFRTLAKSGVWSVAWWDTQRGVVTARSTVTVTNGSVDLPIPATTTDSALQMRFIGAVNALRSTSDEGRRK